MFLNFDVGIHFVVQTALQFGTLAGEFLRIHREILKTRSSCRYRYETGHPCGTAKFASARADAAYPSGFLTRAYLLHLNAYVKCICKHFDELAEVNPAVSYVVEYCLAAITLILNIAYFHLQTKILGNLT